MLIHDLILYATRIGTSWAKSATRTHQVLGLGIKFNPAVALIQPRFDGQSNRFRQPDEHEQPSQHSNWQLVIYKGEKVKQQYVHKEGEECGQIDGHGKDLAKVCDNQSLSREHNYASDIDSQAKPDATSTISGLILVDSPMFEDWVPSYIPDNPTIKLLNVSFKDCAQFDFTLESNCELLNVTFINCKFD